MLLDQLQFPDHFTLIPLTDFLLTELLQTCHSSQDCWVQHPYGTNHHYIVEEHQFSAVPISLKIIPNCLLHIWDEANVHHTTGTAQLWGCECQLDLIWHSFIYARKYYDIFWISGKSNTIFSARRDRQNSPRLPEEMGSTLAVLAA